jgi:hypothetical protein
LDISFHPLQLLRNRQFRINIFKLCGPAGYTWDMKVVLIRDIIDSVSNFKQGPTLATRKLFEVRRRYTEPIIKSSYAACNMTLRYWIAHLLMTVQEALRMHRPTLHLSCILSLYSCSSHMRSTHDITFCWLRRLASVRWPLLGEIL